MPHRDDFDLAPDEIYLNGAYSTPLPRAARDRVAEAYALQAEPYRLVPDLFFEYTEAVRDDVARVLGASSEEVAVTTSTSFGAFVLARSVRWKTGSRFLIGPDEFPSNVYPWLALAEEGVHVETIGRRGYP